MPCWEGIEDASAQSAPVWLQREVPVAETNTSTATAAPNNDWKPLRKTDCQKLNQATTTSAAAIAVTPETAVVIEMGRATAYPGQGRLSYNFLEGPGAERALDYATWFVVQGDKNQQKQTENGPEPSSLEPIFHKEDSEKIEALYQKAVQAASSLGQGIASIMDMELELHDDFKVKMVKQGDGRLALKKMPKDSWQIFSSQSLLQRGYGEYQVPGEETEMTLGPVNHLVFVVHGIGEAYLNRDDFNTFPNLVETLDQTRATMQEKQIAEWKQKRVKQPDLKPPNRIELVPVEWYDELHDSSSSLMRSLRGATLQSIPALRAIANDVIFDLLMYLTPSFCQSVLECVTNKINEKYELFNQIHPDFESSGGKYSLMGHSLGSVICWDLLAIKQSREQAPTIGNNAAPAPGVISGEHQEDFGYQAYAGHHLSSGEKAKSGTWGPSLNEKVEKTLPFVPESTILLGSPCGIFLTLRGAHPVFDEMRRVAAVPKDGPDDQNTPAAPLDASPFTLPTKSLYNIFHPSDPVAYRIEPLLLSPELSPERDLPPPLYLTVPGKPVRLDLKAKRLHGKLKKSLMDTKGGGWGNLLSTAVTALATEVPATANAMVPKSSTSITSSSTTTTTPAGPVFPLGGKSSRVDFSLQPGIIHNEYLSAVSAHSSYFSNTDVLDFVMGLMAADDETVQ